MNKNTPKTRSSAFAAYYQNKITILEQLKFDDILLDKNVYLLSLKRIWIVQDLIDYLLDAYLQNCEETKFKEFWQLISDSNTLYTDIIEPLGHQAQEKNKEFLTVYAKIVNQFTLTFAQEFCDDGVINWQKIVAFNAKKTSQTSKNKENNEAEI